METTRSKESGLLARERIPPHAPAMIDGSSGPYWSGVNVKGVLSDAGWTTFALAAR